MVVASTGPSAIIWNLIALPPQILIGQANPVVLSTPTMSCQAPVPQKPLGALRAVKPSKPELNKRFAEPGAGAGGATVTGGTTGAGAGAGGATVTGGTTGAGAGAGGATVMGGTTGAGASAGEGAVAGAVGTAAVVAGAGDEAVAGGVVAVAVGATEGEVPPPLGAVRLAVDAPPPAVPPADVPPPAAPPLSAPPLAGAVPTDVELPSSTRAARPPGFEVPPAAVLLLRFSVWPGTLSILTSRAPSPGGVS